MSRVVVLLLTLAAFFVLTVRAHAETFVEIQPEPDWMITTATGSYGLMGYGSTTILCWGVAYVEVPLNPYVVAAAPIIGLVLIACFTVLAIGRMMPRKPREQS